MQGKNPDQTDTAEKKTQDKMDELLTSFDSLWDVAESLCPEQLEKIKIHNLERMGRMQLPNNAVSYKFRITNMNMSGNPAVEEAAKRSQMVWNTNCELGL